MTSTERIIQNVACTLEMDGLCFSDSAKEKIIHCLIGKTTFHETVQSIVSAHKQGE